MLKIGIYDSLVMLSSFVAKNDLNILHDCKYHVRFEWPNIWPLPFCITLM